MQRQEAGHCRYDSARLGDIAGTEGRAIEDEGDVFVELASLLEGAETLQMLVLSVPQPDSARGVPRVDHDARFRWYSMDCEL